MDLPDRLSEIEDEDKYSSDVDAEGSLQFMLDGAVVHPKRIKGGASLQRNSSETDIDVEAVLSTPFSAQQRLVRPHWELQLPRTECRT